jgi:hypothetical protein
MLNVDFQVTFAPLCVCECMYVCMYAYMYVSVYVCVYIYIYIIEADGTIVQHLYWTLVCYHLYQPSGAILM